MHALLTAVSQLSSLMHKENIISLINLETTLKPSPRGYKDGCFPLRCSYDPYSIPMKLWVLLYAVPYTMSK